MTKTGMLLLFSIVVCFSTDLSAKTIKLGPNETKSWSNSAPFTLSARCSVHAEHPVHSTIKIVVLKNKGTVNGKSLNGGQGTSIAVHNDSNIEVSADSGTEINLINLGSEELEAVCII